jgi:hypothetical protein
MKSGWKEWSACADRTRNPIKTRRLAFGIFCAALGASVPGLGWSGEPVALVLDETGSVTPKLQPYSEIPSSSRVRLGHDATLVFLDYNSCMKVTVAGGSIEFTPDGYKLEGGKKSQQRVACPGKLTLTHGGEVSANTLRGATEGSSIGIPTRPSFALVGKHRDDFAKVQLSNQGKEIVTIPLMQRHGDWPSDARPLSDDTSYELVVISKDPSATPIKINVRTPSGHAGSGQALVLIGTD